MADTQTQIVRLSGFGEAKVSEIIGPSKSACEKHPRLKNLCSLRKNVILPTWKMYNLAKKQGKIEGDNPKTPFIALNRDDEGVFAEIKTESHEMMKFVKHNLEKYQKEFKTPEKKFNFTLFAAFSKDLIPRLIGRGKSSLDAIRSEAVTQMDEETDVNHLSLFSDEKKTKIWIKPFKIKNDEENSFQSWMDFVAKSKKHDVVGWSPEEDDELIKIEVTCFAGDMDYKVFEDYAYCLGDSFESRIKHLLEKNKEFEEHKKQELDAVMDILDNE